jgi:hypothetical protein
VQAVAGASGGSVGPEGRAAGYVQAGAAVDFGTLIASVAALQDVVSSGTGQRRFDARVAYTPEGKRGSIVLGVQVGQIPADDKTERYAILVYLGLGFTSGHDAPAPDEL